jgi:heme oxygenase
MADALALRAGALAGDNCFPAIFGAPTRRERAAKALNEFLNHVARQQEMEKDPRKAPDACSFHEIAKRSRRAQLFVHALEEELSAEAVNRALRRMLQGLRGTTWGENDLRAALEAESGRDLGAFFRAWLHSEDIPADFRTKYSTPQN